jgi:hypothetical protein
MSAKSKSTWLGCFSFVWMVTGFAFTHFVLERYNFEFRPDWLYLLAVSVFVFGIWWGVGLLLAVAGVKRGNLAGRICAIISICVFVYFAWDMISPIFIRVKSGGALPPKEIGVTW